jgi:selenocysteine lyase/cysteine desulfurase
MLYVRERKSVPGSDRKKSKQSGDIDYQAFLEQCPEYRETAAIDELRRSQFSRLDDQGHVYLDYTGGGLYGMSQIQDHMDLLLNSVLGNPHSTNPSSLAATDLVENCRRRILDFFRASPDEYGIIFTANASQALKLVGESYPFSPSDRLLLTFDNHNSVNGIREFHRARGAVTEYVPVFPPDLCVPETVLEECLRKRSEGHNNLFAYPAQSNFSGVQHPLEWIERAQSLGWDVLLDAAAFVATNRLDLSKWHPDYVVVSFYKMFGYPTGVGALLARWSALDKLRRPWFAGGTITVASVQADQHILAAGSEAFEDGTLNYACLPAVERGLDFIDSIGIDAIHDRVGHLAGWMIGRLSELKHANGKPLVRIYGPVDMRGRGATVAMNFYDASGNHIDDRYVEARANERHISLRTGCFCNPGAGETALGIERDEIESCFLSTPPERMTLEQFRQCIDGKSTGAVRVSLGIVSNFNDVKALVDFATEFCG